MFHAIILPEQALLCKPWLRIAFAFSGQGSPQLTQLFDYDSSQKGLVKNTNPVSPPILQAHPHLFAHVKRHALLGDADVAANSMHKFVQEDRIPVKGQILFVSFQRIVARNTGTAELHTQTDVDGIALVFLRISQQLNAGVAVRADVTRHEAVFKCFAEQLSGPQLYS